ncbi:antibiotic biosynthesis monooxygenase [Arthrobacter sp. FX8]|uniref:putative quinol monooxygenase n=1 Tax=Arthrobacter sp. FX8 TaxID=2997335 RepID=UPI00227AC14C|nr:antibiotic biosynthesis monooxygenase family protein [Arthrobacter sp. FX8]WAJ33006.1 antibiotic biosynthesis monooxygenase [Arthrobacter sp. FX8]
MTTFSVTARYEVAPENFPKVVELLESVRSRSLQEPGCRMYEFHLSADDPSVIFILEQYEAAEDFDRHCSTPHFIEIVKAQIVPLLRSRTVTKGSPLF